MIYYLIDSYFLIQDLPDMTHNKEILYKSINPTWTLTATKFIELTNKCNHRLY